MPLSYKHEDILREIACTELRMDRRDAALMALEEIVRLERELSKVKAELKEAKKVSRG